MQGAHTRKIFIVGAGAQGNVVAYLLSKADDIGSVLLADIDPERARETAANVGSEKIQVDRVDASDIDGMMALMRSGRFDLVVNTALPEFIPQVMLAALRTGTNYLDLSSISLYERKGKPIEQLQHEEDWKASGKTALVNGGSAPGLTNIMAREGADALDEVEAIRIRDYSVTSSEEFVSLWSLPVFLIDCATEPMIWEDGKPKRVPIFGGEEMYDFPPPIDRQEGVLPRARGADHHTALRREAGPSLRLQDRRSRDRCLALPGPGARPDGRHPPGDRRRAGEPP
jgi:saccharopine dehydrogenase-like NADP-dependent oxidoreductase